MRREELHDVAVVEREPGGAEALRVGGQVGAPAGQSGLEIRQPIAAIAERARDRIEPREKVDDGRRVAAQWLLEAEMGRAVPKLAGRQGLERVSVGPVEVRARWDA